MLEAHNITISFSQYERYFKRRKLTVISGLSLNIRAGEIVAVVGSSGSGKSLLAHAILGILPNNAECSGELRYDGRPLTPKLQEKLRGREIALIPQSVSYLDPLMKAGPQARKNGTTKIGIEEQRKAFARYGLDRRVDNQYPFQLSGGMMRKLMLTTAVLGGAKLIIADEPTPGLDSESLAEAMDDLRRLADEGRAVMLITHDLEAARRIADRIAVFYAGTTLEIARASDFCGDGERLKHPYSRALVRALPENGFEPVKGSQPLNASDLPGCPFLPRCRQADARCVHSFPGIDAQSLTWARCVHA